MTPIKILKKEGDYLLIEQYGHAYIRYIGGGGAIDKIFQIRATNVERYDILNRELRMEYTVDRKMRRSGLEPLDYQIQTVMDYLEASGQYSLDMMSKMMDTLAKDRELLIEAYQYVLTGRMKNYHPVAVEGFTATKLFKEYCLPEIECYMVLVSLKNEPIITKAKLKEMKRT